MQPSSLRCKRGTINPSKKALQGSAWANTCVFTKRGHKSSPFRDGELPKHTWEQRSASASMGGCCRTARWVVTAAPAPRWSWPRHPARARPSQMSSSSRDLWRGRSQPRWNTSAASLSLGELHCVGLGCAKFWHYGLCVLDIDTVSFLQLSNCISVCLTPPSLHYLFEPASFVWFSFVTISSWPC